MWDLKACRCCLQTSGKLARLTDQNKKLYHMVTGFEVTPADGFPTHICVECNTFLRKMMQFRRKSRRAHFVLKEIMIAKKQVTLKVLNTIDRKQSNLETQLTVTSQEIINIPPTVTQNYTLNTSADTPNSIEQKQILNYNLPISNITIISSNDVDINDAGSSIDRNSSINDVAKSKNVRTITIDGTISTNDDDMIVDDDGVYDDGNDDTMIVDDNGEEIDMEDIFKGLKEDNDYCLESEPEEIPLSPKREEKSLVAVKKLVKQKKTFKDYNYEDLYGRVHFTEKALGVIVNTEIKVLSVSEQMEMHKVKLEHLFTVKTKYNCGICVISFDSLYLLEKHVTVHNEGINFPYRCEICKLQCETEDRLRMHTANYHLYLFSCKTCKTSTDSLPGLLRNTNCTCKRNDKPYKSAELIDKKIKYNFDKIPKSPDEERLPPPFYEGSRPGRKCDVCRVYYNCKEHKHVTKRDSLHSMQCDICKEWFKHKHAITTHMLYYHMYKFKCKLCDKIVYNARQVSIHLDAHKSRKCEICKKEFGSIKNLHRHLSVVHPDSVQEDCNLCGNRFRDVYDLYDHQLKVHGFLSITQDISNGEFKCVTCEKQFVDKKALHRHLVKSKHVGIESIENACSICMNIFDNPDMLDKHVCKVRYPSNCNYCQKYLTSYSEGQKHRHTCEGVSKYLCELCGESVPLTSLKYHNKTHTGESSVYRCAFCPSKLYRTDQYVMHILRNHTYKAYICTLCPARFSCKSDCRNHILVSHAPAKPYVCDFCDRDFSHQKYLTKHAQNMHNVKLNLAKFHIKTASSTPDIIEIYPFMKLNATHVPIDLFSKISISITDFLGHNPKPVESYDDILILNDDHPPILETVQKKTKPLPTKTATAKKNKIKDNDTMIKENIATAKKKKIKDNDTIIKENIPIIMDNDTIIKDNFTIKDNVTITETNEAISDIKAEHISDDYKFGLPEDYLQDDFKYDIEKTEMEQLSAEDIQDEIINGNYTEIQHEGETCLLIKGVVYKIETEDIATF